LPLPSFFGREEEKSVDDEDRINREIDFVCEIGPPSNFV
jgi:hypothetical protein